MTKKKLLIKGFSTRIFVKKFNVQGSVRSTFIPFDIFPTRCNSTQFIYFWKTALRVSGGISTHHQEHTQLYICGSVHHA